MDSTALRRCYETADFEPLRGWYAEDAVFDALVPGQRVKLVGGDAVVAQLAAWWPEPGRLLRWDVDEFESGLTVELEHDDGRELRRQRQFLQRDGRGIVRHQVYAARPQGRTTTSVLPPLPPGFDIVSREPLTHPGQSGNSLERITLRDGSTRVLKHLQPEGDWIAQNTHDDCRELTLFREGIFARLPAEIDHCVLDVYDRTLVLRDASAELITRMSRDESCRLLHAAAAIHRTFAGDRIPGLCTLEDRITITAPRLIEPFAYGLDFIAKVFYVGWEVFAEVAPRDVADAVAAAHTDPKPLADSLRAGGTTLVHGDLRWANVGLGERVVLLDWGVAADGVPASDFAWYLFVNGRRVDATYDELIDDFRAAEGDLHDERTLELAWLAQLCMHGGLLAHELIESDAAKREIARRELDWWCAKAREAL